MTRWKRWLAAALVAAAALMVILLVLGSIFAKLLVEIWWFDSVGYEAYFWQRALYQYAVLISVCLFFFLIFFLNFWAASRYLGTTLPPVSLSTASLTSSRHLLRMFRSGSMALM